MPALLVKTPELSQPADLEMTIDLAAMTWTCTAHAVVMPLDGGGECPACVKPPPMTPHPLRDSLVG